MHRKCLTGDPELRGGQGCQLRPGTRRRRRPGALPTRGRRRAATLVGPLEAPLLARAAGVGGLFSPPQPPNPAIALLGSRTGGVRSQRAAPARRGAIPLPENAPRVPLTAPGPSPWRVAPSQTPTTTAASSPQEHPGPQHPFSRLSPSARSEARAGPGARTARAEGLGLVGAERGAAVITAPKTPRSRAGSPSFKERSEAGCFETPARARRRCRSFLLGARKQ